MFQFVVYMIMKKIYILLFLCLLAMHLQAQRFSGKIVDINGNPVPYATLFCREKGLGITADQNGLFSVTLEPENYLFEVSALGFEVRSIGVDLALGDCHKIISMKERIYNLSEVNVTSGDEDPAYRVIRYLVASAPSYSAAVKRYVADVYIKGTGKIVGVPSIVKMLPDAKKELGDILDRLFVVENISQVQYDYPGHYDVKVLAAKSSFPDSVVTDVINPGSVNLYGDYILGCESPLGKKAFSLYRFVLEGYYMSGGYMINKIKVIPKNNSNRLLSGYLYVVEGLWCLSDVDLHASQSVGEISYVSNLKEIRSGLFLPSSVSCSMDFSLMGFKGKMNLFSSTSYDSITVNDRWMPGNMDKTAAKVENEVPNPVSKKVQKLEKEMERIMSGDDMSASDAYRVMKISKRLSEAEYNDTVKGEERYNLDRKSSYKVVFDSLSTHRDSLFWDTRRSVPLLKEELSSYVRAANKVDSAKAANKVVSLGNDVLFGHKFYSKNRKMWIKSPGLKSFLKTMNVVDGYYLGAEVEFGVKTDRSNQFIVTPWAYYLTGRRDANYGVESKITYLPMRNGELSISGGRTTSDFNGECGTNPYINVVSSYLFVDNIVKYYEKRYVSVDNEVDLANGLRIGIGMEYTNRFSLDNYMNKFRKRTFEPNIPSSIYYNGMEDNRMIHLRGRLEYTPASYYRVRNGRKVYVPSKAPTLSFTYCHGRNIGNAANGSRYNRVEGRIRQKIDFFPGTLSYDIEAGMFFDSHNIYFPDYKHFAASDFWLSASSLDRSFTLLDNYMYSNPDKWIQGFMNFESQHLILKWLPFMRNKLYSESVHLRVLVVDKFPTHTELGYSIGLASLSRIGIAVSFRNAKYDSFDFTWSIPLRLF